MNTTSFPTFAGFHGTADLTGAGPMDRATRARLAHAATRVRPYLARQPEQTLQVLGFSPAEIAVIHASRELS